MKKFLSFLLFANFTLSSIQSLGQADTIAIKNFIQRQQPGEEIFINLLKAGNIDSCIKFFSTAVINKYGADSLKKELRHLNNLLLKHPNPKATFSLGQNFHGVGTFGHDSDGSFEMKSSYQLMNNDSLVYHFNLYYSDKEPVTIIKYFDSDNLREEFLKKLRIISTVPAQPIHN